MSPHRITSGAPTVRASAVEARPPTEAALRREYQQVLREAQALAGAPEDMAERAALLHHLYRHSRGNFTFPLVALHGALWAKRHFDRREPWAEWAARSVDALPGGENQREAQVERFFREFRSINRQVFIDTYAAYVFTARHGRTPGAERVLPGGAVLLEALNEVHDARRAGRSLTPARRREHFTAFLENEQNVLVEARVQQEVDRFDFPVLRRLAMTPRVSFAYYPPRVGYQFSDFAEQRERVECALMAYDLAERAGWPEVERAMVDYGVLPADYGDAPLRYAKEVARSRLSGGLPDSLL